MAENAAPQTSEELFQMLLKNEELAGGLERKGEGIFWTFKDFWVYAYVDVNEGYIEVNRAKKKWWQSGQLLHWHPMKEEIYGDLCAIGNKNNVLVIRNGCLFSDVFFLPKASEYKFPLEKKWHCGRLYVLKPEDPLV